MTECRPRTATLLVAVWRSGLRRGLRRRRRTSAGRCAGPRATVVPSTSRVRVPSGARRWTRAERPGMSPCSSRYSSDAMSSSTSSVMRSSRTVSPGSTSARLSWLGGRAPRRPVPRDGVAVGAGRGIAEQLDEPLFDLVGDDVLPPAGLEVGLVPGQADDVDEQALGQAVLADHAVGQHAAPAR